MKHSFWRINFYVIGKSGFINRCKRCVQSWSFLADWKRLMLQKGFSHSFWCTRDTWSFFVPNSVCFWRKGKCFTLLSQLATFFFPSSYHICDQFLWTCPQKNICIANWLLLLKKRLKNESWKKTKSLAAKKSRISEDFLDFSTENRKFRRYCIFSLFGQWNQSKEFPNQVVLSGSKVHPLKRNIKDRQRICFLFVDWANWKFFFFVEEMFRVSIVFSCL